MQTKRTVFGNRLLPYALLAPQLAADHRLLPLAGRTGGAAVLPARGRLRPVDHLGRLADPSDLLTDPNYSNASA